ncbi:MAG: TVP38/TMEM64 family protein [Thermosynechococcaceae cyanobacterium]
MSLARFLVLPFTVAAGIVWGPLPAAIYSVIGLYVGSLIAYFIGRTWGRSIAKVLTGKAIYISKHRGDRYLGTIVLVAHLIPVMPYDLISYGAGISGLSFRWFAIPCLLGLIPCVLLLTHVGAALTLNFATTVVVTLAFVLVMGILAWGSPPI